MTPIGSTSSNIRRAIEFIASSSRADTHHHFDDGSRRYSSTVRRYEGIVFDSSRWDGFSLRPGDIIISTPPKCGTTWTQMIGALLVLHDPELPLPLDTLLPWIDMVTRARTELF